MPAGVRVLSDAPSLLLAIVGRPDVTRPYVPFGTIVDVHQRDVLARDYAPADSDAPGGLAIASRL